MCTLRFAMIAAAMMMLSAAAAQTETGTEEGARRGGAAFQVDITEPPIDIIVPHDTTSLFVRARYSGIAGGTTPAVRMQINNSTGRGVHVDNPERFAAMIASPLSVGDNLIRVIMTDRDFNEVIATRIVHRLPAEDGRPTVSFDPPGRPIQIVYEVDRPFTVRGRASDPDGIALVFYRTFTSAFFDRGLRGEAGAGAEATRRQTAPADGTEEWSFQLDGIDQFTIAEVVAIDFQGNSSAPERFILYPKLLMRSDLLVLTEFGDVWGSEMLGGQYDIPVRMGHLGFRHAPAEHWVTLAGDINGNALTDLYCITEFGDAWVAVNRGDMTFEPPRQMSSGWTVDNAAGMTVLAIDVDKDGTADLVQVLPNGDLLVGLSDGHMIAAPRFLASSSVRHDPAAGFHLFVTVEQNILQINNAGGVITEHVLSPTSVTSIFRGNTGLRHDPEDKAGLLVRPGPSRALLMGDEVGLWQASYFVDRYFFRGNTPTGVGFHNDPTRGAGWWMFLVQLGAAPFAGNVNYTTIQLTEFGDIWMLGTDARPNRLRSIGFHHKPDGPWQMFVGNVR